MYFVKSNTTATLQHWPARLVPPPRDSIGAPCSRHTAHRRDDIVFVAGNDDADGHLAVVGAVGRVERAAAAVEADLAAHDAAKIGGKIGHGHVGMTHVTSQRGGRPARFRS